MWLFEGCTPKEHKKLRNIGTRVRVPGGRTVCIEGGHGTDVVVVVEGMASCHVRGETVANFGPGDFFGEVSALDGGRRTATVVADTDMDVLVLGRAEFDHLLLISPEVARRMLHVAAGRLRQANRLVPA